MLKTGRALVNKPGGGEVLLLASKQGVLRRGFGVQNFLEVIGDDRGSCVFHGWEQKASKAYWALGGGRNRRNEADYQPRLIGWSTESRLVLVGG